MLENVDRVAVADQPVRRVRLVPEEVERGVLERVEQRGRGLGPGGSHEAGGEEQSEKWTAHGDS